MLGIGMQEILIILVVALIVIGPKRLPELARTLGKGLAEFRKAADDLQETVRRDLQQEKHEDFRKKYPHLVPEEEGGEAPGEMDGTQAEAGPTPTPEDNLSGPLEPEPAPQPPPEPSPEPSSPSREIEGGDETEDDTRNG